MPFIIGALVLVIDQISKLLCANWLPTLTNSTYPIIQNVLHLTYVENSGAAFGLLQNAQLFFFIMTILLCSLIMWFLVNYYNKLHTLLKISIILILAGALGNFIDRIGLGYVRDMIDFRLINFYVFNVADASLTIGVTLTIIDILFLKGGKLLAEFEETAKEKRLARKQSKKHE
ncbi:MAG: signal peptidase II [Clostridia bacterium]